MSAIATNDNGTAPYRHKFEGSKYRATEKATDAQIAKMIREDIKAAQKAGELPAGLKVSVRIGGGRTCSSIRVEVTAAPFQVLSDESLAASLTPNVYVRCERYSDQAKVVSARLKAIHNAYNFDDSDAMVDYFHVRFYGEVGFDWQLEKAERDAYVAHFGVVR